MSSMGTWVETMNYVAGDPARPAILIALAQTGTPLDETHLATSAGYLYQHLSGQAIETAVMIKHVRDLSNQGLLERDEGGLRWQLTPLGTLVSRQWAPADVEPEGSDPLSADEIRTWRDNLCEVMEQDAGLADTAGIANEELVAVQSGRLSELRILNRILGEAKLPEWLSRLQQADGGESPEPSADS